MILAVLQARLSSKRLPGKVLRPILGVPMLVRQIERIRRVKSIDQLVVATSIDASDDILAETCKSYGIDCFRGNLEDVLDRYYQAATQYGAQHVVRLTGDCPLTDPCLIEAVIAHHLEGGYDATGADMTRYPDGLDVDIVAYTSLQRAWREARLSSEREHVIPYIANHPELFKLGIFCDAQIENGAEFRWTVDAIEDFEFVTQIYEGLYPLQPEFRMQDIIEYLRRNPEIALLNKKYHRNEGYEKSLKEDYYVR